MKKDLDIVAMGSTLVDVLTHIDEKTLKQIIANFDLIEGGMTLVNSQTASAIYNAKGFGPAEEQSGGSVANTAVGINSFGGKTAFMGRIGQDQFGEIFEHDIKAAGVEVAFNHRASEKVTGRCLVMVTPDGERTMATNLSISAEFSKNDLNEDFISRSKMLFLEVYSLDSKKTSIAFNKAAQMAKQHKTKVVLTLSDAGRVKAHHAMLSKFVPEKVDVLIANEQEIMAYAGTTNFDEAIKYASKDVPLICVTRGAKGAVVIENGKTTAVSAEKVSNVEDTTGAGDSFAAGFLYGITHGHSPEESAKLGAKAAAHIIQKTGPRPSIKFSSLLPN